MTEDRALAPVRGLYTILFGMVSCFHPKVLIATGIKCHEVGFDDFNVREHSGDDVVVQSRLQQPLRMQNDTSHIRLTRPAVIRSISQALRPFPSILSDSAGKALLKVYKVPLDLIPPSVHARRPSARPTLPNIFPRR